MLLLHDLDFKINGKTILDASVLMQVSEPASRYWSNNKKTELTGLGDAFCCVIGVVCAGSELSAGLPEGRFFRPDAARIHARGA
jgi:hypothetical protein